jgi:methylenetetrahydrofolate dehydrogenase (NADP+)/methenyltetrahydrofolate cyclohydrolase
MSAKLLDGRTVAKNINEQTRQKLAMLDFVPGLGVVLVGTDPASHLYVRLKEKACHRLGLNFIRRLLPTDSTPEQVLAIIKELNSDSQIHGIIVQLPLPTHLPTAEIIAAIAPIKDADGFHPANQKNNLVPPVLPSAVVELLRATNQNLTGQRAVVIAKNDVFFSQMEKMLKAIDVVAKLITPDKLRESIEISQADILIVAVGQPALIKAAQIKPGAIVIDIGTNKINNQTIGDVDTESAIKIAGWLTPVPGGVGPVTVAQLLKNVVLLAEKNSLQKTQQN